MAAYAALVSVLHTIDQIKQHPHPPISLDHLKVHSLTENISILQDFLEGYSFGYSKEVESPIADVAYAGEDLIESRIVDQIYEGSPEDDARRSKEVGSLERRIADAAYAAEDIIESRIVDAIFAPSTVDRKTIGCFEFFLGLCKPTNHEDNDNSSIKFSRDLEKVIEDMDLMKKEVMEIKEKMAVQDQLQRSLMTATSSRFRPSEQNIMVSFDDVLNELLLKLIDGQHNCQIIPIVGMGGIGKTTLSRNIFVNPHVRGYFDIRAWATISQEYSMREILREVIGQENIKGREDFHEMTENDLGEKLRKHLHGRRYMIVLDDMWSISAWEDIKFFFPDNGNGSRILITTRLSNLASQLIGSNYSLELKLLDEVKSWKLFRKTLFNEEKCPLELKEVGKKIARNCKGLPLSIVVVGGLLAKSTHTPEYWEYIAENLNSVISLEDDERCFEILYMSYNQLPVHLKSCFLYMGVFPEDHAIRASILAKLWAAEGFLKPIREKVLEEVAKGYLKDLIDRNLILVHKLGSTGNIKECKIHDLLRDLCLREAQRDRFYDVGRQPNVDVLQGRYTRRRIVVPEHNIDEEILHAVESESLVRSLISDVKGLLLPLVDFRLLRIFRGHDKKFWYHKNTHALEPLLLFVNLRYIAVKPNISSLFTPSVYFLWNLQTLLVDNDDCTLIAPVEIWNMPQLRHVEFTSLILPYPQSDLVGWREDDVLQNLQTLGEVLNLNCCEEVMKRIPNIKKLKTLCAVYEDLPPQYVITFDRLHKLESLCCTLAGRRTDFLEQLFFPRSLKKLTLQAHRSYDILWEDMLEKAGSLPLLEKLKLVNGSFKGGVWETVEGKFCSLKFLKISLCDGLVNWTTESAHFPRLEHLVLEGLKKLEEIPYDIGEIPTLKSIKLEYCSNSSIVSAKRILEEQEALGEEVLQVRVRVRERNEAMESLKSSRFQIEYFEF